MKRLSIISIITAAVAFGFASCADQAEEFKKGTVDAAGCYGVYFPAQKTNVILDPADPTVDTILVARTKTEGAITVPYTLKDANNIFVASELKFEDGQTESYIALAFDSAQVGVTYKLSIAIEDPNYASQYTSNAIAIDIAVTREKWNSLGMAKYTDYWFMNKAYDVEILQNDNDKNKYRLIDAYKGIDADYAAEGYTVVEPTSVLEFQVLKPGDVFADVTITEKGLVAYPMVHTGFIHPSYNDEVVLLHPCNFSSHDTEDTWLFNKVLQYQENGLPAGIQFAPYYYMMSVGGWNYADANAIPGDGGIQFIFPGAVLTDYSLEIVEDFAVEGKQDVAFVFGADVAFVDFGAYDGALNANQIDSKIDGILAGTDSAVVRLDSTSVVTLEFPATGQYTIVAVAYDADSVPETAESLVINYVAKSDSVPVDIFAELVSTKKYERTANLSSNNYLELTVYGSDLVDVKMGLFPTLKFKSDPDYYIEYVAEGDEEEEVDFTVSDKVLEKINEGGYTDIYTGLNPGTSYTLVVVASNGFEQGIALAEATTTGDPLPIFMTYEGTDIDDDLLPATISGYEKKYDFYAIRGYGDSGIRELISTVDMVAVDDSTIKVVGMFGEDAAYFKMHDTVYFEYYQGVLYTLATAMYGDKGYHAAVRWYCSAGYLGWANNYAMVGGFVDEDHIAFVDGGTPYGINGMALTAYTDSAFSAKAGDIEIYLEPMFVTAGYYDENLEPTKVNARLNRISAALKAPRTNYVQTEIAYFRSTVDNFWNAQKIASCGSMAGYAITPEPRSVAVKVVAVKALERDHSLVKTETIRY